MKNINAVILVVAVCVGFCTAQEVPDLVAQMKSYMNADLNPCDDFYAYACGGYIKSHPVPSNVSKNSEYFDWPAKQAVLDHVEKKVMEILKQPLPIINDFFVSCDRSSSDLQRDKMDAFNVYRANIDILTRNLSSPASFGTLFAKLFVMEPFLQYSYEWSSLRGSGMYITFGGTYYYDPSDYKNSTLYAAELAKIEALFKTYDPNASRSAVAVMNVEQYIISFASENSYSPYLSAYNASELLGIDFLTFSKELGLGLTNGSGVFLDSFNYLTNLTKYIRSLPTETLKRYLEWRAYTTFNNMDYYQICNSTGTWLPECGKDAENFCGYIATFLMPDLIQLIYGESTVNSKSKDSLLNISTSVELAFNNNLPSRPWMNSASIQAARLKLMNMLNVVGTPDLFVEHYSGVSTLPNTYFLNFLNIEQADSVRNLREIYHPFNRSKLVGESQNAQQKTQRKEAGAIHRVLGDAVIVGRVLLYLPNDVTYMLNSNFLWFPAASVDSPFYHASWPKLFQYAGMGTNAAAEISTGFDLAGMNFNSTGVFTYPPIYDSVTVANLRNKTKCLINQYNKYVVVGNLTVNGEDTLSNNLADYAGLKLGYTAYQNYVAVNGKEFPDGALLAGFSTNQVFLLYAAQQLCSVENEYYLRRDGIYSTPNKWRVNGAASQFSEFGAAFRCPVGSPMNSANKCNIW